MSLSDSEAPTCDAADGAGGAQHRRDGEAATALLADPQAGGSQGACETCYNL